MSVRVLSWSGTEGGKIAVSFDDEHFGAEVMQTEIESMHRARPNLPDEVPLGTVFAFAKEPKTGHLRGHFRVGDTVDLIEQLLHPVRYKGVS